MASLEYVLLCACLITSFGILSVSLLKLLSVIVKFKLQNLVCFCEDICLVSVMRYMMQHVSDSIQVFVNVIQQHKCVPLVFKLHHFRREERNFVRPVYYKVCC